MTNKLYSRRLLSDISILLGFLLARHSVYFFYGTNPYSKIKLFLTYDKHEKCKNAFIS